MRYLRNNTATRITVGPFLDKTDGVTPEVAITVTACKLTFMVDTGGVPTLILDVAPTASGGANDMVHVTNDDAGFYDLELAAADVNYFGRAMLAITDATVHCPVFHEFMIIPAVVYDAMFLGTDTLEVDVVQWLGTACATPTVAGVPEVDLTHVAGATTNVSALATNVDAILTDTGTAGVVNALIERNYIENGTAQSGTANTITLAAGAASTNDLWVGQQISIYDGTGAGQTRGVLNYNGSTKALTVARNWKVNPDATSKYKIQLQFGPKVNNTLEVTVADAGADLTAIPWNPSWDTEVQSECVDALTAYGASTHSAADTWAVATRVLTAGTNIVLAKGTGVTGFNDLSAAQVNTEADTALTDYGASTPTDVLTQVNAALDAAGTELTAIPTTTGTIRQKLNFVFQYFRNKKTVTSTTEILKKEDASTTLGTATVSDDGTTFTKGEMN